MSLNQLFVHVGLHKTATTYLQRGVFPHWSGIDYLGVPYDSSGLLPGQFEGIVHSRQERPLVLSNEKFSFRAITPETLHPGTRRAPVGAERAALFEQLHHLLPNAGIILCLRHPVAWVESIYSQYLKRGGVLKPEEFWSDAGTACMEPADAHFRSDVEYIRSHWPAHFIYLYEDFSVAPQASLDRMADFMNVPRFSGKLDMSRKNSRLSQSDAQRLLEINRSSRNASERTQFLKGLETQEDGGSEPFRFDDALRQRIEHACAADWAWVSSDRKIRAAGQ